MKNKNYTTGTGDLYGFEDDVIDEGTAEFSAALEEFNNSHDYLPETKTIVEGTYNGHDGNYAVISTSFKTDVLVKIDAQELSVFNELETGTDVEVLIQQVIDNKKETTIYGSASEVAAFNLQYRMHEKLEDAFINNKILSGIPVSYTIFGYDVILNINDDEAIIHMPHLLTDVNKLPNPDSIIGQEINFRVLKNDKGTFIASRKAHLLMLAKKEMKNLKTGTIYTGFVTGTKPYAVFVQIGNCTGMVHVSNLGNDAKTMLKNDEIVPGMEIEVYLRDIMNGNLVLSQISGESLWDKIRRGEQYEGTISSVKDFNNGEYGILVQLDYETRGMIHSSTVSKDKSNYTVGKKINVQVQNVFKPKRQITLIEV